MRLSVFNFNMMKPAFVLSVMSLSSISVYSAVAALPATDSINKPTKNVTLIRLNETETSVDNDSLSKIADMLEAADETDDSIDSVADESVLSADSEAIDSDIPEEVAEVSLNAISPETLKTFVAVVDLVRREYIDTVNDEELFVNAMSGMLRKLDSHAEFLDAEAYENLRAFTQGEVGDVGLKVTYRPKVGYWVVTDVIADSPADKKGIAVGDYLHQIDEFKLDDDERSNDIEQRLSGIAGTQVDVVTSKAGRRKRTSSLQRNNNHPQAIEVNLDNGVAIIRLPAFQDNSRENILEALIGLDAPISGILLDVRDNPGGVLTSAVKVASLFMTDTDVVQVKGRQGDASSLRTSGSAVLKTLPVVILQNRYSASAAEVLASSLQAEKRATIVGEVSYGKGSVQSVIPLNDEQAVKLTVAYYLTASGKKIDEIGVEPDSVLSGAESTWQRQAMTILRQQITSSGIRLVRKNTTAEKGVNSDIPNANP